MDDRIADYGHVVMDECRHVPAPGFTQVADRARARYVTGLSATVTRKDGQHPALFMQCGPIRHRVDARRQADRRPFSHQVLARPTGFRMPGEPDRDPRIEYRRILVLRFLAEDLGTRLDAVLDEVLRALARRMPSS